MRKILVALVAVALSFASCKKTLSPQEQVDAKKSAALIKKYGLTPISSSDAKKVTYTKEFRNFDDFEKYLIKREQEETTFKSQALNQKNEVSLSVNKSKESERNTFEVYTGTNNYSATHHFTGFHSSSFPCVVQLSWSTNSSATSNLYYHGTNAGSYTYSQSLGGDMNGTVTVTGLYVETFGVNGVFTYSRIYDFSYRGDWEAGHISGSATFIYNRFEE